MGEIEHQGKATGALSFIRTLLNYGGDGAINFATTSNLGKQKLDLAYLSG